jgi:hypothetical protein
VCASFRTTFLILYGVQPFFRNVHKMTSSKVQDYCTRRSLVVCFNHREVLVSSDVRMYLPPYHLPLSSYRTCCSACTLQQEADGHTVVGTEYQYRFVPFVLMVFRAIVINVRCTVNGYTFGSDQIKRDRDRQRLLSWNCHMTQLLSMFQFVVNNVYDVFDDFPVRLRRLCLVGICHWPIIRES